MASNKYLTLGRLSAGAVTEIAATVAILATCTFFAATVCFGKRAVLLFVVESLLGCTLRAVLVGVGEIFRVAVPVRVRVAVPLGNIFQISLTLMFVKLNFEQSPWWPWGRSPVSPKG